MLLAFVIGSLATCAGLLVYGSGRGLDLTDEIFYLVWANDPKAYALVYQPFGYLLHPLFRLVGGNLQLYRIAGFTAAGAAGALLGYSLPRQRHDCLRFTLYGATSALTMFFPWIITPSYNSAADVGALLVIGGILIALENRRAQRFVGAISAGAGLCVAAFAKPPLFALSAVLILVLALVAKVARAALISALVLGAVLISLFLSPAQAPAFVERIVATQHILALPNTPLSLPAKVVQDWLLVPLLLSGAAVLALLSVTLHRYRWFKWAGYAAVALSLCYFASVVGDALDGSIPDFVGLGLVTLAAGYAGLVQRQGRGGWIAVALLLGAPSAVALGTFNNQWAQLNLCLPFPLMAVFFLACTDAIVWRRRTAQALALAGPVALMLLAALAPYSLPTSIFEQHTPVQPPVVRGSILVDDETAAFLSEARGLAHGALLVDLSGTGPGVAAVLGGRAPVLPWLNPATPTWPDVVWSRLSVQQRRDVSFVVPVWREFRHSAPANWLAAHRSRFCRTPLPEMPFWGEERTLELWRPCRIGSQHTGQNSR